MKITVEIDTKNKSSVQDGINFLRSLIGEAHSVTETAPEPTKKQKTTPSKAKVEKAPEEAPTQEAKSSITIDVLKDSAKNAVTKTDRTKVKEVINEFAEKLAEVKEADYGKLYKKLQELGK